MKSRKSDPHRALAGVALIVVALASCARLRDQPPSETMPPGRSGDSGADARGVNELGDATVAGDGPEVAGPPCQAGSDCPSGKCCEAACIASTACCGCDTTPRCVNGNALTASCDGQGACKETVVECGAKGCSGGRCNQCEPHSPIRCDGDSLITCDASGSGAGAPIACGKGCNSSRLECNVCAPNTQSCNGPRLDTCKPDGAGFTDGACSPTCLPAGGCCTDLDCGRCNQINPCRRCGSDNRCEDSTSEPACSTQGSCSADATSVCMFHGGTCEVRTNGDRVCRYQLCRWSNVSLAACGQAGNRGIPTEACHRVSLANPGMVPAGADGACVTQVENITGAPFECL